MGSLKSILKEETVLHVIKRSRVVGQRNPA